MDKTEKNTKYIDNFPINQIKVYGKNAKIHTDYQIEELSRSISIANIQPICINGEGRIIAGHGRLQALRALNQKTIPVIQIYGLTEEEEARLRIADNKVAELSEWNTELLAEEVSRLVEDIPGFAPEEIDRLIDGEYLRDDPEQPDPVEMQDGSSIQSGNVIIRAVQDPCQHPLADKKYDGMFIDMNSILSNTQILKAAKEGGAVLVINPRLTPPSASIKSNYRLLKIMEEGGRKLQAQILLAPATNEFSIDENAGVVNLYAVADETHINLYNASAEVDDIVSASMYQSIYSFTAASEEPARSKILLGNVIRGQGNIIGKRAVAHLDRRIAPQKDKSILVLGISAAGFLSHYITTKIKVELILTPEKASRLASELKNRYLKKIKWL